MAPDAPHRRPGRPVADAPIERLLADTDDVARSWMFELLSQVPLHEAPGVVTEPFTRDGPRVCDAALRALAEENDLRRLERDGALWPLASRVGEMTGSSAPGRVLVAVDALHDVLWRALRGELRAPVDPDLVADLAARLTRICGLIRDAGLARAGGGSGLERVQPGQPAERGGAWRGRRGAGAEAWPEEAPGMPEQAEPAEAAGAAGTPEGAGAPGAGETPEVEAPEAPEVGGASGA